MRHSDEVTAAVLALADREDLLRQAVTTARLARLQSAITSVLTLLPDD